MISIQEIASGLTELREKSPLVHNITNYVVMNNTANALLAIVASPVMAHAEEEVEDMINIASSLVINMGTLSKNWVASMLKAGKKANEKGIPVVFDPVGAGATHYRTEVALEIIEKCKPSIIRGNASEIMALFQSGIQTKGVDSSETSNSALETAKKLAIKTKAIISISGETDFITNGKQTACIKNGSSLMVKVTGMGCTASAISGAFAGTNSNMFKAAIQAMAIMGVCGELAVKKSSGPGSLQMNFIDCLFNINAEQIEQELKLSFC